MGEGFTPHPLFITIRYRVPGTIHIYTKATMDHTDAQEEQESEVVYTCPYIPPPASFGWAYYDEESHMWRPFPTK